MIDDNTNGADEVVEAKLNEGLAKMAMDYEVMSSQKVGPTIADDIKGCGCLVGLFLLTHYLLVYFNKI